MIHQIPHAEHNAAQEAIQEADRRRALYTVASLINAPKHRRGAAAFLEVVDILGLTDVLEQDATMLQQMKITTIRARTKGKS